MHVLARSLCVVFLASCAARANERIDVCDALALPESELAKEFTLSGRYNTDGAHSGYLEGVKCRDGLVLLRVSTDATGKTRAVKGADDIFSEAIYEARWGRKNLSYDLVVIGHMQPAKQGEERRTFLISQMVRWKERSPSDR